MWVVSTLRSTRRRTRPSRTSPACQPTNCRRRQSAGCSRPPLPRRCRRSWSRPALRGGVAFGFAHAPAHVGVQRQVVIAHQHLAVGQAPARRASRGGNSPARPRRADAQPARCVEGDFGHRSDRRYAAVHRQDLAGDVLAGVGREQQRRALQVFVVADAAQRRVLGQLSSPMLEARPWSSWTGRSPARSR
jgi:hypothetical protein